jgi:AmiR/NasT family two-component response regulator
VVVLHPPDPEGEELLTHLRRIGCRPQAIWPPPKELPSQIDVVLLAVRQGIGPEMINLWRGGNGEVVSTRIAIVDYESPLILTEILHIGVHAVLAKPIRPIGVLTTLVVAREISQREAKLRENVLKLERKVGGMRKLSKAKSVLMDHHNISEDEAYKIIRDQAMAKRVSTEEIANAILNANSILNARRKSV